LTRAVSSLLIDVYRLPARQVDSAISAPASDPIPWQADILLWGQIAREIGVTPQAPVLSQLVDVERGVTVYAYDDRGMDITALSPDPIVELYTRFDT
jgi:hypothetical protein